MPQRVQLFDGELVEFEDGTPEQTIQAVVQRETLKKQLPGGGELSVTPPMPGLQAAEGALTPMAQATGQPPLQVPEPPAPATVAQPATSPVRLGDVAGAITGAPEAVARTFANLDAETGSKVRALVQEVVQRGVAPFNYNKLLADIIPGLEKKQAELLQSALAGAAEGYLGPVNAINKVLAMAVPGEGPFQRDVERWAGTLRNYQAQGQEHPIAAFMGSLLPMMQTAPFMGPGAGEMAAARNVTNIAPRTAEQIAKLAPTTAERVAAGARVGAGLSAVDVGQRALEPEGISPVEAAVEIGAGAASVAGLSWLHAKVPELAKALLERWRARGLPSKEELAQQIAARVKEVARQIHPDFAGPDATAREVLMRNRLMAEVNAAADRGDLERINKIADAWERGRKPPPPPEEPPGTVRKLPRGPQPPAAGPPAVPEPPPAPPQTPQPAAPLQRLPDETAPGGERWIRAAGYEGPQRRGMGRPELPAGYSPDMLRNAPDWLKADNATLAQWARNEISDLEAAQAMTPERDNELVLARAAELETARRATDRGVTPAEVPPKPPANIPKPKATQPFREPHWKELPDHLIRAGDAVENRPIANILKDHLKDQLAVWYGDVQGPAAHFNPGDPLYDEYNRVYESVLLEMKKPTASKPVPAPPPPAQPSEEYRLRAERAPEEIKGDQGLLEVWASTGDPDALRTAIKSRGLILTDEQIEDLVQRTAATNVGKKDPEIAAELARRELREYTAGKTAKELAADDHYRELKRNVARAEQVKASADILGKKPAAPAGPTATQTTIPGMEPAEEPNLFNQPEPQRPAPAPQAPAAVRTPEGDVIEALRSEARPLTSAELMDKLGLDGAEAHKEMVERLQAMTRSGLLKRNVAELRGSKYVMYRLPGEALPSEKAAPVEGKSAAEQAVKAVKAEIMKITSKPYEREGGVSYTMPDGETVTVKYIPTKRDKFGTYRGHYEVRAGSDLLAENLYNLKEIRGYLLSHANHAAGFGARPEAPTAKVSRRGARDTGMKIPELREDEDFLIHPKDDPHWRMKNEVRMGGGFNIWGKHWGEEWTNPQFFPMTWWSRKDNVTAQAPDQWLERFKGTGDLKEDAELEDLRAVFAVGSRYKPVTEEIQGEPPEDWLEKRAAEEADREAQKFRDQGLEVPEEPFEPPEAPFSVGSYAAARAGDKTAWDHAPGPPSPVGQPSPTLVGGPLYPTSGQPRHGIHALGLPEIIELAQALGRGKYPQIAKLIRGMYQIHGQFFYKEGDPESGGIKLAADIFKDPDLAARVAAHEVGHWGDFLPDATLKRGNILGHLGSLVKYLKDTMSKFPMNPVDFISEQDRARLRKRAKDEAREEYEEEVELYITTTIGVSPEDILSIWNNYTPTAPKELIDYIKSIDRKQMKAIIKAAMEGMVHADLERFGHTIREATGKTRKVKKVRYTDAEQKFRELLFEEIRRRNLVTKQAIWDEMWTVSVEWRPLGPNPTRKFLDYRKQPSEVYADFVSAFLNDPGWVQSKAPVSFDTFIAWLEAKPEMHEPWLTLQAILTDPNALKEHRWDRQTKEMAKANKERFDALTKQPERMDVVQSLLASILEEKQAWYHARRVAKKNGTYDPEKDPIYDLEAAMYANSRLAWMVDNWDIEVRRPLRSIFKEIGLEKPEDLGVFVALRRVAVKPEEGGRAGLANPLGFTADDAQRMLDWFKERFTPDQVERIYEHLGRWADMRKTWIDMIGETGTFSEELVDLMGNSVDAYSTDAVSGFLNSLPSGWVFPMKGTLRAIADPLLETMFKDMAMMRFAGRNEAIRNAVNFLKEGFPDQVQDAKRKGGPRGWKSFKEPKEAQLDPKEWTLVRWFDDSKAQGVYMKRTFADGLERKEIDNRFWDVARGLHSIFRALTVTKNPFWAMINIPRDFQSSLMKLPLGHVWMTLPIGEKGIKIIDPFTPILELSKYYLKAAPDAWKDVFLDTRTPFVHEMLKNQALIQSGVRFYTAGDISEAELQDLIVQRMGLHEPEQQALVMRLVMMIHDNLVAGPGEFGERWGKIAGAKFLKENQGQLGLTDKQVWSMTRRRVSTPDIKAGGTATGITNVIFPFSNVAMQDIRTNVEVMSEDPAVWTQKLIYYTVIPKYLMAAGALGLLGRGMKAVYDRVPEYHKTNFIVVPLGITDQGKAVYLLFPHGFFQQPIAAMLWKGLTQREDFMQEAMHALNQSIPLTPGSITPFLEMPMRWSQFLAGQNPQDPYRGRSVIPAQAWKAQDKSQMWGYMLRYTWNNFGLGVLYPFDTDNEDEIAGNLGRLYRMPFLTQLLRRFIRVSDYGLSEKLMREDSGKKQEANAITNERDLLIRKILDEDPFMKDREVVKRFLNTGTSPGYKDDPEHRQLIERIRDLRLRDHGDPFQRALSYKDSRAERDAIEKKRNEDTENRSKSSLPSWFTGKEKPEPPPLEEP